MLDDLIEEFRLAVHAADHIRAGRLAGEYADTVRRLWEAMPEEERAHSPLPRTSRELLTWARGMTIVQRAIAGEQLAVVQKLTRYGSSRGSGSRLGIHVRA